MRALIAGAGFVGSRLAVELADAGHDVWALRRSAARVRDDIPTLQADLCDPATLSDLPRDLDWLVYAASADERSDAAYARTYVGGLHNVLECPSVRARRPERIVFTSSTAVYGQHEGEWVDERSPTEPSGFNGRRLLEAEQLLKGVPGASVLRLAGIYGPGRNRLLESIRRGEASYSSTQTEYTNRIHRDDCAGAIAHLLTSPQREPCYIGVDDEPVAREELLRWLAGRLRAPKPNAVPTRSSRRSATNKRCSNKLLRASGYALRFPSFRDGYTALLDAL